MSVTDEIKTRIDIVNYVQRFVPSLKKAGRHYKACCPFHAEKTPSFVVNPERQTWRCFGACAEGGDLFTFAQKMNGWDFKETLRELGQEAGVPIRQQTPEQKPRQNMDGWDFGEPPPELDQEADEQESDDDYLERLRGMLAAAADYYHRLLFSAEGHKTLLYARNQRGLTEDTIKAFQIGYAPNRWDGLLKMLRGLGYGEDEIIEAGLAIRRDGLLKMLRDLGYSEAEMIKAVLAIRRDKGTVYDRFRHRLMIPIRDERGRVVGFGGRALDPQDKVKYINSPQTPLFNKSQILFGLDSGKRAIRDMGMVVIVEGYLDVIQAHQAGYRNVVAQMGTAMTAAQVKQVMMTEDQVRQVAPRYTRKIVIALDADEAGRKAARRSLEVVYQALAKNFAGRRVDVRVLQMPAGKDPDDFLRESPEAWESLVDGAQSGTDLMRDMAAGLPFQEKRRRERAIESHCLGLLMKHPNLLYQVNRKLRELADNDDDLLQGPLSDLGIGDFTQSQYRTLMRHFQESIAQDDMEPLRYVESVIERELRADFEALLIEAPEAVSARVNGAFQVDMLDIFKKRTDKGGPGVDVRQELVGRALQLRLERLEQERVEMQYLQEESQSGDDQDSAHHHRLNRKIILSIKAKARIDWAVSQAAV